MSFFVFTNYEYFVMFYLNVKYHQYHNMFINIFTLPFIYQDHRCKTHDFRTY